MAHSIEAIRNIALLGQSGSGKTTLAEALLARSGAIASAGSVDRGNTVSDADPLEKAHRHSLETSALHLNAGDAYINLLDTPGLPEFIGHAISALSAVETAAVVVNAQTGVETMTQRLMDQAARQRLCRMIVVNKIDADHTDTGALVDSIRAAFGDECLPINLPTGGGSGVVDCFFNADAGGAAPDFSSVDEAHTAIVDQVIELDEDLMELYLEQGVDVGPERLHDAFEQALREGHLIPVCFVSAQTGAGVAELLTLFERLAPSPLEGNPQPFRKGTGDDAEPFEVRPEPEGHVVAHVFKITIDPFIGRLALFRVHQGTVTKDSQLFIGDGRKPFKVGHLLAVQGRETQEIDSAGPGDLAAVGKIDEIVRGAVLHDSHDEDEISLEPLPYPTPLFGLAVSVQKRGDEQKLSDTLNKLVQEDPGLAVEHNQATGQTVLRGISDLHLRIALEKMNERFKLQVATEPPKIAYRETIAATAEGHHRHKKQTGGAGQFGEVMMRIEPLERGAGFEFKSEVVGGAIPTPLIPAVEKGVREALDAGAIAGYPLQDVRAVVTDGKHHPVDSKEVAFITAGREAFLAAVRNAKPKVLEPIVKVRITAPADAMGAITGDLSSRRGQVSGSDTDGNGNIVIEGQVPLAELSDYQSQLTSMTGGAGSYTVDYSHYDPVPGDIQQKLIAEHDQRHQTQG